VADAAKMHTSPPRRQLEGVKAICEHLGFAKPSARRVRTWAKEGMPARFIGGRWVAYADEIDRWWADLAGP
jgi:hypothetical protein